MLGSEALENPSFDTEAFEYIKDAVVLFDDSSNIVYLNTAAEELYGVKRDAVLGLNLSKLFAIEWQKSEDEKVALLSLNNKGYWVGQNYHLKPSGHKFLAQSSLTVFQDAFKRKRGTIAIIRNTDSFKAHLKESEEHFGSVLLSSDEIDKQQLANIIDVQALQLMMDDLYSVTKIGFALIDLKGNVLAATGWQDICTKFHRVNPQTIWNCLESDLVLSKGVRRGEFRTYKCKNNMWDIVTPLIIGGRHLGNIFSGQFFFEDESIDRKLFAKQAEEYGFDKNAYLSALDRVPRWNRDVVKNLMQFYVKLAELISKQSYTNIRLAKSLADQRQIEKELRNSQHDLNHAQTVAKTGSWRLDVQSNKLLWSDETYQIYGVTKGTPLTYDDFLGFIHPEDKQFVDGSWKAALRGERYDIEHRIVVDNNTLWVRERAELEFDKNGSLVSGFGTVQDITEHKLDEERLRRLNRALRAISNSNQTLMRATDEAAFLQQGCRIIIEDCGYRLVWIGLAENDDNKTVRPVAYAGFDKGYIESLNITWSDTEHGRGPTGRAIRTGKPQICKNMRTDPSFAVWSKQATERGYVSSAVLPLISEGKAFGALNVYSQEINVFSDDEVKLLSELASDFAHGIMLLRIRATAKQAEEELRKSENVARHRAEELEILHVQLEKKAAEVEEYATKMESIAEERARKLKDAERLAAIGQTAGMVGHDIRNPLQTINLDVYFALSELKGLPQNKQINRIKENLEEIQSSVDYVNKIVQDLQDFVRPINLTIRETALERIFRESIASSNIPSNISTSYQVDENAKKLLSDAAVLKRIIANLISNAIQSMPNGGKINLHAYREKDETVLTVSDTGAGIPEEIKQNLFTPILTTREGQGFGLAVVKRMTEALGGVVNFDSTVGKVSMFTIRLPPPQKELGGISKNESR